MWNLKVNIKGSDEIFTTFFVCLFNAVSSEGYIVYNFLAAKIIIFDDISKYIMCFNKTLTNMLNKC